MTSTISHSWWRYPFLNHVLCGLFPCFPPKKGKQNLSPLSSEDLLLGHCFHFSIKALEKESTFLNKPPPHTKITPKKAGKLHYTPTCNPYCWTQCSPDMQQPSPPNPPLCLLQNFFGPDEIWTFKDHKPRVLWYPYRSFLITRNDAKTLSLPISTSFIKSIFSSYP